MSFFLLFSEESVNSHFKHAKVSRLLMKTSWDGSLSLNCLMKTEYVFFVIILVKIILVCFDVFLTFFWIPNIIEGLFF